MEQSIKEFANENGIIVENNPLENENPDEEITYDTGTE